MKVNITGRGIIPGLGVIPPIYNKEMSIPAISRLLNFPNFSVFDATTERLESTFVFNSPLVRRCSPWKPHLCKASSL